MHDGLDIGKDFFFLSHGSMAKTTGKAFILNWPDYNSAEKIMDTLKKITFIFGGILFIIGLTVAFAGYYHLLNYWGLPLVIVIIDFDSFSHSFANLLSSLSRLNILLY